MKKNTLNDNRIQYKSAKKLSSVLDTRFSLTFEHYFEINLINITFKFLDILTIWLFYI